MGSCFSIMQSLLWFLLANVILICLIVQIFYMSSPTCPETSISLNILKFMDGNCKFFVNDDYHNSLLLLTILTCCCIYRNHRAKPIIVDPGLYLSKKSDIAWTTQRRSVPTSFKLFTGKFPLFNFSVFGSQSLMPPGG